MMSLISQLVDKLGRRMATQLGMQSLTPVKQSIFNNYSRK